MDSSLIHELLACSRTISVALSATKWNTSLLAKQNVTLPRTTRRRWAGAPDISNFTSHTSWGHRRVRELLGATVGAILIAAVVGGISKEASSDLVRHSPGTLCLELECIIALLHADEAHFTPVFSPRVADNPVLLISLSSPNNRDDMINHLSWLGGDATSVLENG